MSFNDILNAQVNVDNTKVTYRTGRYLPINLESIEDPKYRDRVKKVSEIEKRLEYELLIDEPKSLFQLSENSNLNPKSQFVILAEGLKEVIYYNSQGQINTRITTNNGKQFKIISKIQKNIWEISSNFKFILGYKCYKATTRMELINPITKEPNIFNPIVWFTYTLPIPFGPHLFNGLPGLILEATFNGRTYFYASKIDFDIQSQLSINNKDAIEISEEQYFSILIANFKERQKNGY